MIFLGIGLLANIHLTYFAGFKQETTFRSSVGQAVDALAVGVVASLTVLLVLNRVAVTDPLDATLGKIVLQTVPLSIGASVANLLLRPGEGREGNDDGGKQSPWRAVLNDMGATAAGASFVGMAIAPTEEIPMLAAEMSYAHELALIALSLLLTYAIVFESGFDPQAGGAGNEGPFHRPITETALAYLVALLVAFLILFLFDQIKLGDPLTSVVSQTLVLGLPAAIGGAAGRLVI